LSRVYGLGLGVDGLRIEDSERSRRNDSLVVYTRIYRNYRSVYIEREGGEEGDSAAQCVELLKTKP
jgi:hypothetical protein